MSAPEHGPLHEALHGAADATTPREIDLDVVLRESRSRRRARRTAVAGGAGALAAVFVVGGLVVGMQQGFLPAAGGGPAAVESAESGDASSGADSAAEAPEAATGFLVAPEDVNHCGEPVAGPTDAAAAGLAVSVTAPAESVEPGAVARVTVTLTNVSGTHIDGVMLGTPSITIADDGLTVGRPDAPVAESAPVAVSLAPGASATLIGALQAEACGVADAAAPSAPAATTPLPPGAYELGAIVAFTPAGGAPVFLLSPYVPLTVG